MQVLNIYGVFLNCFFFYVFWLLLLLFLFISVFVSFFRTRFIYFSLLFYCVFRALFSGNVITVALVCLFLFLFFSMRFSSTLLSLFAVVVALTTTFLVSSKSFHELPPLGFPERIKKESQRGLPYISSGASCKVCWEMTRNLLEQLDMYMDIAVKDSVSSYEVEDFLDHICDPFATSGWWMRKFRFFLHPMDPELKDANISDLSVRVNFSDAVVEDQSISKCTRACYSIQESCEFYLEDVPIFDSFPSTIARLSKDPGPLNTQEHFDALNQSFCMKFVDCYARKSVVQSVNEALNSINVSKRENPRKHWLEDKIEPLEESNYAAEFFAYNHLGNKEWTKKFSDRILKRIYALRDAEAQKNLLKSGNTV